VHQYSINLVVDKCKNKNERADFNQYIKLHLQQQFDLKTNISIQHKISKNDCCLQAVDLFCWVLQRKAEKQNYEWLNCFQDRVKCDWQYFEESNA
jgi:hypothetical protein